MIVEILVGVAFLLSSVCFVPMVLRPRAALRASKCIEDTADEFWAQLARHDHDNQAGYQIYDALIRMSAYTPLIYSGLQAFPGQSKKAASKDHDAWLEFISANGWCLKLITKAVSQFMIGQFYARPWNPQTWMLAAMGARLAEVLDSDDCKVQLVMSPEESSRQTLRVRELDRSFTGRFASAK